MVASESTGVPSAVMVTSTRPSRYTIPLREPLEGRPSTDSLGSLGVVSVVSLWTKNLLRQASELCQLGCVKRIGEVAAHGVSEGGLRGGEDLGPLFGH